MANEEHLNILKQGVKTWNQWREENPDIRPDLREADLNGVDLRRADLYQANLSQANLSRANLYEATLERGNLKWARLAEASLRGANLRRANIVRAYMPIADLTGADLSEANLREANLGETNLSGTNLTGANLCGAGLARAHLNNALLINANLAMAVLNGADFTGANLAGMDITGAGIGGTNFCNVDFSTIKRGLDTVDHSGPSTIGIDTIYHSGGKIPETFLRGAGVPDTFITYIASLTGEAIQYYSCFISYSSKDQDFAERLYADLQNKGVRCWFAPEDLKIGAKIRPTIDETIRLHDKLLLVLSEHSVASQWVEQEVETVLARERKQDETVLFPIRLDDAVMEMEGGWPALIKNTRNIGNFSQWKDHDAYQKALNRLLRDLKANS